MTYNTLLYEKRGLVGSITLNLPDSGNAITAGLCEELAGVCANISADEEVRAVIITGAGKDFCLGTLVEESPPHVVNTVINLDCPVIAAINGNALGQGLELALACDLRIAAETARLGLPQIAFGLIPWDSGTQLLPRIIGRGRAMEMILTGEAIDATRAYEIGLVNRVVPLKELVPTAMEIAVAITSKAPIALRYAKEAIHQGLDLPLEQGLRLESDLYHLLQTSKDRVEGIKAFQERRTPQFKGK